MVHIMFWRGEADWNRYLNRIEEKNWYVDFSDIQMICYKLTESGIWSHEHINPLYLEVEFPTYIEDDPKTGFEICNGSVGSLFES